jgi:predicted acylesterase/phospholipase RssA
MRDLVETEHEVFPIRSKATLLPAAIVADNRNSSPGWGRGLRRTIHVAGLLLFMWSAAQAEDPCASVKQRALVLGGGGIKGAFETGAVYHLVVHRGCDFAEFSGVSVGALNAAFLAQAQRTTDASESHSHLADRTEELVTLWHSLKKPRDIARGRPLATLRFGVFGLENLVDFTPLRRLEDKNVSLDRLANGRSLRVGVVSFHDGKYREIVARSLLAKDAPVNFMHYLYASSTPPVFGKLPQIPESAVESETQQFADGSLRHITPVDSYVVACKTSPARAHNGSTTVSDDHQSETCFGAHNDSMPAHELIQQLFVVVTSPYSRDLESWPVLDPKCCRPGTRHISDGRKILNRTLALLDDEVYRRDIDYLLSANEALAWRWQTYQKLILGARPEDVAQTKQIFHKAMTFAYESFNHDAQDPDAPSLPYEIGLVIPQREYAEIKNLLALSPESVQEQLFCGCVATDQMMQTEFGLPSLINKCVERFPRLATPAPKSTVAAANWDAAVCEGTSKPTTQRTSLPTERNRLDSPDDPDLQGVGSQ